MQQEAAGVYQTVTYLLLPPKIGNGNRYIFLSETRQRLGFIDPHTGTDA